MTKPVFPKDIDVQSELSAEEAEHLTNAKAKAKRKTLLILLAGTLLTIGGAVGGYELLVASHHVVTDNAYVGADVAQVTPLLAGQVSQVLVSDTQAVKAGQVLVVINDIDARLELEQARAAVGQAERRVRSYMANDDALAAQIAARAADQGKAAAQTAAAQSDLEKAQLEYLRREKLAETGFVSSEQLTRARNALRQAEAALASSRSGEAQAEAARRAAAGTLAANATLTSGAGVEDNPEVLATRARVSQAEVNLERTRLRAPFDGVVTKRQVQVGQRVSPGAQLMTVVPVTQAYVDANYKEVQLTKVRIGQPVELESDLYGSSVKFHGRVAGLSGGTGSAFALIPAQNATGNWIKVVQRLPVRIALDPAELAAHPLRVGLTMKADIDINGH